MFKNPGKRIKKWAKVLFIVLLIIAALALLAAYQQMKAMPEYSQYAGVYSTVIIIVFALFFVLFAILAYVSCLMVYGYGELVDNSKTISDDVIDQKQAVENIRGDIRAIYLKLRDVNSPKEDVL